MQVEIHEIPNELDKVVSLDSMGVSSDSLSVSSDSMSVSSDSMGVSLDSMGQFVSSDFLGEIENQHGSSVRMMISITGTL
ncbi:hypothetical protein TNCV_2136111 [Trichonephila clavipes]|nr:hypothetical protein TNCV_2136111 [Trichonephila clavipes]